MDAKQIANEILRVIRNELGDCERAINELDDATTKLTRLADQL
jgi:hypothetical protein